MCGVVPCSVAHGQKDTILMPASASREEGDTRGEGRGELNTPPSTNPSGYECPLEAEGDQCFLYCFIGSVYGFHWDPGNTPSPTSKTKINELGSMVTFGGTYDIICMC